MDTKKDCKKAYGSSHDKIFSDDQMNVNLPNLSGAEDYEKMNMKTHEVNNTDRMKPFTESDPSTQAKVGSC